MTSPPRAILSPNGVAESIFAQALSRDPLGRRAISALLGIIGAGEGSGAS
jgi:hypothetical protein